MPTGNWQNWTPPYSRLDTFTRHEPYPNHELKDTYVGGVKKPKKKDAKALYRSLRNRWDREV